MAESVRPRLWFDSSEKWRPLDIPSFLAERNHRVCRMGGTGCRVIRSENDLLATAGGYLDVNDPPANCQGYSDCNSGFSSSIYYLYRPPGTSPLPAYHLLDYWFYYRYNPAGPLLDHEGDWEGVLMGISKKNPGRFDWVGFASHEHPLQTFYYISPVLSCERGGQDSCSRNPSSRLDVFVANRSHASYPKPCSLKLRYPLFLASLGIDVGEWGRAGGAVVRR